MEKLEKKAQVMAEMIIQTAKIYHASEESEKGLMETLVGAGIFYLPNHPGLFNNKISKEAWVQLQTKPEKLKLVAEHAIPRKVAGRLLYTKYLPLLQENPLAMVELYEKYFGRYNLVLKEENDRLRKFQKAQVFVSEEEAYALAGIELVDFTYEEYLEFQKFQRDSKKKDSKKVGIA